MIKILTGLLMYLISHVNNVKRETLGTLSVKRVSVKC